MKSWSVETTRLSLLSIKLRQIQWKKHRTCFCILSLVLALLGCENGATIDQVSPPPLVSPKTHEEAIEGLLTIYSDAMSQEDIDRLQSALQTGSQALPAFTRAELESTEQPFDTSESFREVASQRFRRQAVTGHDIPTSLVAIASDRQHVTFYEIERIEIPDTQTQQTQVFRTTFQLTLEETANDVIVRIATARREGPLVQVITRGQLIADRLARLEVLDTDDQFPIASGHIQVGNAELPQTLNLTSRRWHTVFRPAADGMPLQVQLSSKTGQTLNFAHHYRVRVRGEGVVQPLVGATPDLRAIALSPDGTVWAGGAAGPILSRVKPGERIVEQLRLNLAAPNVRVEDLAIDQFERLHAVIFSQRQSGVILSSQETFCQTVAVFDADGLVNPAYPFRVQNPVTGETRPSPSTRSLAAGDGSIWLFGSDGGVARVTDSIQQGQCVDPVTVQYGPIFRRDESQASNTLLTNTVPALIAGHDQTLWFGTALGLVRWKNGQFSSIPFDRPLSFSQRQIATLEGLIGRVATAIMEAQPIEAVDINGVSFLDFFGRELIKADLIFSAVEDSLGRIWVGTLGGGIRRIEHVAGEFRDTLHLTRAEAVRITVNQERTTVESQGLLASNIIFALAVGPDGSLWAATDDGLSRIEERADASLRITTFSSIDGLPVPVRDVAVSDSGIVWLATEDGLFRLLPQGRQLAGRLLDPSGMPIVGADVLIEASPFRAVTDKDGAFVLDNLPPDFHTLQITSRFADQGPFTEALRLITDPQVDIDVGAIVVVPRQATVPIDPSTGGQITFPSTPGAALTLAPNGIRFDNGVAPELSLTLLPPEHLPFPAGNFVAVAAAELSPKGAEFTAPVAVTLPNQGELLAGRRGLLLSCFNKQSLQYEFISLDGQVSEDGLTVTGTTFRSPGRCLALVFFQ